MIKFEVTLKALRKAKACVSGYNKAVRGVQGLPFTLDDVNRDTYIRFAHKEPISLLSILESNGLADALWALRCVEGVDRDARLFAVWCARQVQHLMENHQCTAALDVAERFANGKASSEELDAAHDAAHDAAEAAAVATARYAARYVAGAAAGDKQEKILISMCLGEARGKETNMTALKPKHLKALKRAIEEAACWRGSLTGDPDPTNLNEFDRFIATAEKAFEIIKKERNEKATNRKILQR